MKILLSHLNYVFLSLVLFACCYPQSHLAKSTELSYINAYHYYWAGGAAGLSGETYEIDLQESNVQLIHMWTKGLKLNFKKVGLFGEVTKWRATITRIEGQKDDEHPLVDFPVKYSGEGVISYQRDSMSVEYFGIPKFEIEESKDYQ